MIPYLLSTVAPIGTRWIDPAGNLHIDTRTGPLHRTLFVAHVDTVHRHGGPNRYIETPGKIAADGAALGADDAAGVALLAVMIGQVPGYYIFTRGEEAGGIGAKYLAQVYPDLLRQFDRAIAFDRKGTSDVISHQNGGPCCSSEFAEALSTALNDRGMLYMPAPGIYTDTAEFVGLIPECTNISAGYYREHSPEEWLDTEHLESLCRAVLGIEWDSLPTSKDGPMDSGEAVFPPVGNLRDQEISDAVDSALAGNPADLALLVAGEILPDDPRQALRFIDRSELTPGAVLDVCDGAWGWEIILSDLVDLSFNQP